MNVDCPICKGEGKILLSYNDPGPNTYWECHLCQGKGYIEKEYLDHLSQSALQGEDSQKELKE